MTTLLLTAKRSWPVLLAYGLFSLWGITCLIASLVLVGEVDGPMLAGVLFATLVGHLLGNVLGLTGLRALPVFFLLTLAGVVATLVGFGVIAPFAWLAAFCALGGYLGVASRLDVVAAWYPLSFCTAGVVIWINHGSRLQAMQGANKFAIWDGYTLLCLAGCVFLMLVFLATRNSQRLTIWQQLGRVGDERRAAHELEVARPGRGSLLVLLLFTLIVLGATGLLAPYLFYTETTDEHSSTPSHGSSDGTSTDNDPANGDADERAPNGNQGSGREADKPRGGGNGGGNGGGGGGGGNGGGGGGESEGLPPPDPSVAAEAFALGSQLILWLFLFALLLALLALVVFPPLRRAFLLRHLERPRWPVPPTVRVRNLWRWALAHLAMLEITPSVGETSSDFARRVHRSVPTLAHTTDLLEAAHLVENIDYAGRGLGPQDEQRMREAVTRLVGALRAHLTLRQRLAAAWETPPEVDETTLER